MTFEQAQQVITLLSNILAALKPGGTIDARLQEIDRKLDEVVTSVLIDGIGANRG
jgi:hypothetical protein